MRGDAPTRVAIHATAVAIGDRALLILGPSRSGKSRLASALMARTTRSLPIDLVGDDRILIEADHRGTIVRPHPRIAGFIERRGLGLCAVRYRESARLLATAHLGLATATHRHWENFPAFSAVQDSTRHDLCDDVLPWFRRLSDARDSASCAPQWDAKADAGVEPDVKD